MLGKTGWAGSSGPGAALPTVRAGRQTGALPQRASRLPMRQRVSGKPKVLEKRKPATGQAFSKVLCHLQRSHDSFINVKHFEPDSLAHYCSFVPR